MLQRYLLLSLSDGCGHFSGSSLGERGGRSLQGLSLLGQREEGPLATIQGNFQPTPLEVMSCRTGLHIVSIVPCAEVRGAGVKRSSEESTLVSSKVSRITKYGLKFQSAGNLVTVGDKVQMEEGDKRGSGYKDSVEEVVASHSHFPPSEERRPPVPRRTWADKYRVDMNNDLGPKLSFGFSKIKKSQHPPQGTDPQETDPPEQSQDVSAPGPPPLMSRQRELMTKAFGGDSDSDEEGEGAALVKMAVRGTPRFMFQIRK